MRRMWLALLLLVAAALAPAGALAHGVAGEVQHAEVVEAGPYKLLLEFDTWPLRQAKNFQLVVHPQGGTEGLKGHLTVAPGPGVKGETWEDLALRGYPGVEGGWLVQAPGAFGAGRWEWAFAIDGPRGKGTGKMTVRFDEAPPFPVWAGWLVGLTPLWGLIWFAFREARRVRGELI